MLPFPEIRSMVYTELKGKPEQFVTGGLRQASEEILHVTCLSCGSFRDYTKANKP